MDLTAARPFTSEEGVTFTPWTDGVAVGFRITRELDDKVEYVALNPSASHGRNDWTGRGDVFVYHQAGVAMPDADVVAGGDPLMYVDVFGEQ